MTQAGFHAHFAIWQIHVYFFTFAFLHLQFPSSLLHRHSFTCLSCGSSHSSYPTVKCFTLFRLKSSEVAEDLVFLVPGHRGRSLIGLLHPGFLPGLGRSGAQMQAARAQRVRVLSLPLLQDRGGAVAQTLL